MYPIILHFTIFREPITRQFDGTNGCITLAQIGSKLQDCVKRGFLKNFENPLWCLKMMFENFKDSPRGDIFKEIYQDLSGV